MIAFPSMLVSAAAEAEMKTPPDPDNFDRTEFPHFHCFCQLQLGRRMQPTEHWENAKIIAAIPENELKTMMFEDFLAKGLIFST